jgi:hypothetical protein
LCREKKKKNCTALPPSSLLSNYQTLSHCLRVIPSPYIYFNSISSLYKKNLYTQTGCHLTVTEKVNPPLFIYALIDEQVNNSRIDTNGHSVPFGHKTNDRQERERRGSFEMANEIHQQQPAVCRYIKMTQQPKR